MVEGLIKLISPLSIYLSTKKKFILNLNQFRNTHFRQLNKAKILYKDYMREQINKVKKFDNPVALCYTVYKGDGRRYDVGNICSVHQKFFEDALVELGKLTDDNHKMIPISIFFDGVIDKTNPRVEIDIIPLDKTIEYILGRLK